MTGLEKLAGRTGRIGLQDRQDFWQDKQDWLAEQQNWLTGQDRQDWLAGQAKLDGRTGKTGWQARQDCQTRQIEATKVFQPKRDFSILCDCDSNSIDYLRAPTVLCPMSVFRKVQDGI